MKVFVLAPRENWICDRFVKEWNEDNADISVNDPRNASVIWLLADFAWNHVPYELLKQVPVLTSIHHIVPEKWDVKAQQDFNRRDAITDAYHVCNKHTYEFVKQHTSKPITISPFWANQSIFAKSSLTKQQLRKKYNIPEDAYVIGSFQRDTEGSGISQGIFLPKLEKGADLFCDYVEKLWEVWNTSDLRVANWPQKPYVVLAGWRRQYIIQRLKKANIPFTYFELPPHENLVELYQTLDLYPVTARYEGGPQSLVECGLLDVPVVSRNIGIASIVLPPEAINNDVFLATPSVPQVDALKLPQGYQPYRQLLESLDAT